jgi:hypothetical protein
LLGKFSEIWFGENRKRNGGGKIGVDMILEDHDHMQEINML